jgi:hypothetical protein
VIVRSLVGGAMYKSSWSAGKITAVIFLWWFYGVFIFFKLIVIL